jgi:hypothetical protein
MAPFTKSVAKFLTTPHRVLTRGGATWSYDPPPAPSDAELIPEIPKAMRRELRVRGIVNIAVFGVVLFALQLVAKITLDSRGAVAPGAGDLISAAIVGGVGMLVFGPNAYHWAFWRQLRYRRRHGKWRWQQ